MLCFNFRPFSILTSITLNQSVAHHFFVPSTESTKEARRRTRNKRKMETISSMKMKVVLMMMMILMIFNTKREELSQLQLFVRFRKNISLLLVTSTVVKVSAALKKKPQTDV